MSLAFVRFVRNRSVNTVPDVRDQITESAARAIFMVAWANQHAHEYHQIELTTVAPPTSPDAYYKAVDLTIKLEKLNEMSIDEMYWGAANYKPDKHLKPPTPKDFGWYLAMEALGEGVTWADDHPDIDLIVPTVEFHIEE